MHSSRMYNGVDDGKLECPWKYCLRRGSIGLQVISFGIVISLTTTFNGSSFGLLLWPLNSDTSINLQLYYRRWEPQHPINVGLGFSHGGRRKSWIYKPYEMDDCSMEYELRWWTMTTIIWLRIAVDRSSRPQRCNCRGFGGWRNCPWWVTGVSAGI